MNWNSLRASSSVWVGSCLTTSPCHCTGSRQVHQVSVQYVIKVLVLLIHIVLVLLMYMCKKVVVLSLGGKSVSMVITKVHVLINFYNVCC